MTTMSYVFSHITSFETEASKITYDAQLWATLRQAPQYNCRISSTVFQDRLTAYKLREIAFYHDPASREHSYRLLFHQSFRIDAQRGRRRYFHRSSGR